MNDWQPVKLAFEKTLVSSSLLIWSGLMSTHQPVTAVYGYCAMGITDEIYR